MAYLSSAYGDIGKLRLTVVTNPTRSLVPAITYMADPAKYVAAEIRAVKPALLYGDSVQLRSHLMDVHLMATSYERISREPSERILTLLLFVANAEDETLEAYGISPGRRLRSEIGACIERFNRALDHDHDGQKAADAVGVVYNRYYDVLSHLYRALFGAAKTFADSVDLSAFAPAVRSGILKLDGWSDGPPEVFESEEDYVERAADMIYVSICNPASNLVLDANAARMFRREPVKPSEVDLAASLLGPLPGFARATIDEIVDIREELASPLTRFRSEVAKISRSLPDHELSEQQISELWRIEILPALHEIDELTKENKYLRQLIDKVSEVKTTAPAVVTCALGFAVFSGIAQACVAATGLAAIPLEALRAMLKQRKELRRKRFYFLLNMHK